MDQDPNQFWSVAQEGWGKALAAFGQMGKADGVAPPLSFDPEKVAELQNQYINEASAHLAHSEVGIRYSKNWNQILIQTKKRRQL